MRPKRICFVYEDCLENNIEAQRMCKALKNQGFIIFILSDLPRNEVENEILDFALANNISYHNIIYNENKPKLNLGHDYDFKLYFTDDKYQVDYLNKNLTSPMACYIGKP